MITDDVKYVPILSIKPAEMAALEELPEKDKDLMLPLIPLKRWANSNNLENSIKRVEKAFGNRKWILDIDKTYISDMRGKTDRKESSVFYDLERLVDSSSGFKSWVDYVKEYENIIPAIQFDDVSQLKEQLSNLKSLGRPVVARFEMTGPNSISPDSFNESIKTMISMNSLKDILIILDYGDVDRVALLEYSEYSELINRLSSLFNKAAFAVSGTSFPYGFSGSYRGEVPIYERQIFNKVCKDCPGIALVYSDRGSTRSKDIGGGGGVPRPRIDYPLKNDWRFIRKDFDGRDKEILYQEAALEIMKSDYWNSCLRLWGTQMIEKTSLGDPYGITSANRATAVRINIHLYQQLHYMDELSELDTEEDWED